MILVPTFQLRIGQTMGSVPPAVRAKIEAIPGTATPRMSSPVCHQQIRSRSELQRNKLVGIETRLCRTSVQQVLFALEVKPLPAVFGRRDLRVLFGLERVDQRDLGLVADRARATRTVVRRFPRREAALIAETKTLHLTGLFCAAIARTGTTASFEERANALQLVSIGVDHVAGRELEERDPSRPSQRRRIANAGAQGEVVRTKLVRRQYTNLS